MARWVLDASALLALIEDEPGAGIVRDALPDGALDRALMSTVNLAEVAARLRHRGWPDRDLRTRLRSLQVEFLPFGAEAALESGALRTGTAELGLGLGDRACLKTAASLRVPALTAARAWLRPRSPGIEVRAIR